MIDIEEQLILMTIGSGCIQSISIQGLIGH